VGDARGTKFHWAMAAALTYLLTAWVMTWHLGQFSLFDKQTQADREDLVSLHQSIQNLVNQQCAGPLHSVYFMDRDAALPYIHLPASCDVRMELKITPFSAEQLSDCNRLIIEDYAYGWKPNTWADDPVAPVVAGPWIQKFSWLSASRRIGLRVWGHRCGMNNLHFDTSELKVFPQSNVALNPIALVMP